MFTTKGVHMQITKQTTSKTIINHSSTKTSLDSTWYRRRLRQNGSLLAHYILEDFERLPISLPKSAPDLKNMYIKPRSEKPKYQKTFKWLKNRKMTGRLDRSTLIKHTKIHI